MGCECRAVAAEERAAGAEAAAKEWRRRAETWEKEARLQTENVAAGSAIVVEDSAVDSTWPEA